MSAAFEKVEDEESDSVDRQELYVEISQLKVGNEGLRKSGRKLEI